MKIQSIKAQEILDSRGQPTVSATVYLSNGVSGSAAVPAGASTGSHEAHELRDNDPKRFGGRGVLRAVANVEKIAEQLAGREAADQATLDKIMLDLDGTPDKANLGANAILAVSLAAAAAEAKAEKKPLYVYLSQFSQQKNKLVLPIPLMNILNGGRHANWTTDFQEYLIVPFGFAEFGEALRAGAEIYQSLRQLLVDKKQTATVGDEGGFAPAVADNEEPLRLISQAIERAGYDLGREVALGLDAAASEFYKNGQYCLAKVGRDLNGEEMLSWYRTLSKKYPLISLEDPLAEDDWNNWSVLTAALPETQIIGDDLYATNPERLAEGLKRRASNSILVKVNQIGTLSETMAVINRAQAAGWSAVISHRSGETEDTFIADLAVAFGVGQIKIGAPARGERTVKYNRLLAIAEQLGAADFGHWPIKINYV